MTIDDRLPVDGTELMYGQLSEEGELWPVLFEKAFAKLFGGYEQLDGNSPLVALKALTGCVGDQLMQLAREPDGTWACLLPSFRSLQQVMTRKGNWPYNTGSANKDVNELFELLSDFHHDDCIMAASISAPSAGSDHFVDGRCVSGSLWSLLSERTASSTPISIHAFLCQHPSPTHLTSKQPV